jgi:BsuBI/PstI restriction endonuclease domain
LQVDGRFVHCAMVRALGHAGALGVTLDFAAEIPDVIIHHRARNWLSLIEAVTSVVPVDGKRRKEFNDPLFSCKAGLVFVTAFEGRRTMQTFVSHLAWESEVWIAEDPNHMIHFNGKRFLGPYPDVMPTKPINVLEVMIFM